jgi:hypothetical protein
MEITDLVNLIASNSRHQDYERVCKLASDYKAWVTGEGLDAMLEKIVKRESEEDFKQRLRLTAHIIPTAVNKARTVFTKGLRSNAINLYYSHSDTSKTESLSENLSEFYGMKDERRFLDQFSVDMTFTDPNGWLICETEGTDGDTYAKSYPFYVSSDDALDFKVDNGVLEWLFIRSALKINTKDRVIDGWRYTLYGNDRAIIAEQIDGEPILPYLNKEFQIYQVGENYYFKDNNESVFVVIEPEEYNLTAPIAMRWGYIPDALTMHRTYVSALEPAIPYFKKALKAVSELDLGTTLHAFPQKIEYAPRCQEIGCNCGTMPDGGSCPKCHGSGFQVTHTSAQDVIRLALPRTADEAMTLTNLVAYVTLPIEVLNFQNTYVKELTAEMQKAIFNSDTFTQSEIQQTATEQTINLQAVYDTIYPFAVQYSELWAYIVWQTAEYMSISDGLTITKIVKQDFKLKTFDELMADLKAAKDAGADVTIINGLSDDIASVQYKDEPDKLEKHNTMQRFNPFIDKTENEKLAIVSTLPMDNDTRVLYTFYGQIFNDIDIERPEFYSLATIKQREIIYEYVAKYKGSVTATPTVDMTE